MSDRTEARGVLVDKLRKIAKCIYIEVVESVAKDISLTCLEAAALLDAEATPAHGWQSMESAPKDGGECLIFVPADEDGPAEISLVRWNGVDAWQELSSGWALEGSGPTHWMPLPDPPAQEPQR